jgi:flagellar protein FlgJ
VEGTQPVISAFDWQNINTTKPADSPERIRETARQFESVLLGMMLKSMREASGAEGWLGAGEDQSLAGISELAEQQVAEALSSAGGLGLAKLVVDGLNRARIDAGAGPAAEPSK